MKGETGNTNNNFETLFSNYFTADYIINYNLSDKYNLNFSAKNILIKNTLRLMNTKHLVDH